jgi:hypothetical protein
MGAHGTKMRTLADIAVLREWLAAGARGLFVLDVAISQSVVADYMSESMAPILAADEALGTGTALAGTSAPEAVTPEAALTGVAAVSA